MEFGNMSLIAAGNEQSAAGATESSVAPVPAAVGPQFWAPYPAGVASAAAVVDQQFCLPYFVQLTVSKKTSPVIPCDFAVTDVNGVVIFKDREKLLSLRDRRVLLDGVGNPVVTIQRKIWSFNVRWRVFRGDSSEESNFLFSLKKASNSSLRVQFDVFLAANTTEESCDFKIRGNYYLDRQCTVYIGSTNGIIAQMSRRHTTTNASRGKDAFGVTVHPNFDYAFVLALVVVLEGIYRWKEENSCFTSAAVEGR